MSEPKNTIIKDPTSKSDKGFASVYSSPSYDLFNGAGNDVLKSLTEVNVIEDLPVPESNQTNDVGFLNMSYTVHPHPLNYKNVISLKDLSTHHSSCIHTKKFATVGLGFYGSDEVITPGEITDADEATKEVINILKGNVNVNSDVDDLLDELTPFSSFNQELLMVDEDMMDGGIGYLEVARNSDDEITGIRHMPVADIHVCTMGMNIFYKYVDPQATNSYMALFGHKTFVMNNCPEGTRPEDVSEIIPFRLPSNRIKFYGYPDWLPASVDIDLTAMAKQYKADFFKNRGVLDFIIGIMGGSLDDEQWKDIQGMAKGATGSGNAFRSGAINVSNPEAKLQVERLAGEMNTEEQFAKDMEVLAQNIVSGHRVPPLLANILIPGKLGSSNEFINALIGFQLLVIGPYQQIIQSTLSRTLGNSKYNGGLDLDANDFRLRTLTSQINIAGLDTISRSRSEATSGENEDRDYSEGVKE